MGRAPGRARRGVGRYRLRMKPLAAYAPSELRLVYRVLHAALLDHEELMDSELLSDLFAQLRLAAAGDGVDTSDHGAWDRWLGATPAASSVSPPRFTVLQGGQP